MRKKMTPSSDLVNLEDATATSALSKVSNTRRRKLLTTGAGLVASAAAPTGIGLVGLALPDSAHAISVIKATLDGYKIIWQEPGEGTLVNKAGIRSRNFSAIALKDNRIFYGTYEKRMFLPPLNIVYVHKFIPFSEANLYWNKPADQWIVEFRIKNILKFARIRDGLLNPLTCGATWSKRGSDYQHRELVPVWNPDMPEAEVIQRRKLALLRAFYDWQQQFSAEDNSRPMTHGGEAEDLEGIITYVQDRQNSVRAANLQLPEAQQRPIPEPEEVLEGYFDVEDVSVAPTSGNETPLYYRAVLRRYRRPETGLSNFPGYPTDQGRRASSANTYHIEMIHRVDLAGIIYSTIVTRSVIPNNLEQTMPYLPQRQLVPRLASVERFAGRYRTAVERLRRAIPNEEIRAAVYNMQTELYAERIGNFITYAVTPLVVAAILMGRRNTLPETASRAADFDAVSAVLTAMTATLMQWVASYSLEIYQFFNGVEDDVDTIYNNIRRDNNNGWRWYHQHFDDRNLPHRRLIGYTYDVKDDTPAPPAVRRWAIKMNLDDDNISVQTKIGNGAFVNGVPLSLLDGEKLTVKFTLMGATKIEQVFTVGAPASFKYGPLLLLMNQTLFVHSLSYRDSGQYTISARTGY